MKVLLIGGTKFIGKEISSQLKEKGYDVFFFNRGKTNFCPQTIQGDINQILDFKAEIQEHNFDAIIHCIAFTPKHGRDLVELVKGQNTKLIVLGSCDCYEAFQGLNHKRDLAELPIDENSELSSKKYYWANSQAKAEWAKEYDKNLMSEEVMKAQNDWTIFRLPMVYGPGDYQYPGRHGFVIQHILEKKKRIILTQMEQSQLFTYGYIKNIAAAIVHGLFHENCRNQIYNLGDLKTFSRRRWVENFFEVLEVEASIEILPTEVLLGKDWENLSPQNFVLDNKKFIRDTDFTDPVPLELAIKETFEYAKENPECLGEKIDFRQREKALEAYQKFIGKLWKS